MEDKRNLHLKVQEMADCFATTNYLEEMSKLSDDANTEEAAIKWVALATLHAINSGAKAIKFIRSADGQVRVGVKYKESELPSPGSQVGEKVVEVLKGITHLEGDKGKALLALGVRNDSLEVKVKYEKEDDGEEFVLKFPK